MSTWPGGNKWATLQSQAWLRLAGGKGACTSKLALHRGLELAAHIWAVFSTLFQLRVVSLMQVFKLTLLQCIILYYMQCPAWLWKMGGFKTATILHTYFVRHWQHLGLFVTQPFLKWSLFHKCDIFTEIFILWICILEYEKHEKFVKLCVAF